MNKEKQYQYLLLWLSSIFAVRVFLQYFLLDRSFDFLPDFELWHSNILSYSVLLFSQLILLTLMLTATLIVSISSTRPKLGRSIVVVGWLYTTAMIIRLLAGVSVVSEYGWFDSVVSTTFHFVLAGFLIVFGAAIKGTTHKSELPVLKFMKTVLPYPCIIAISYILFFRLTETGSPLMFSAYLSVLIGASAILIHETLAPHREAWRPHSTELINDGLFLVLVQVALPAVFKAAALLLLLKLSQLSPPSASSLWPHSAAVLLQVGLMLVIAEFFRYWIHRASHHYKALWKLHAVHHASTKLYTVNVGRFHPLDKSLQFLGDTLPFLLLGISPEVFAAYFVFYAINGFYQHSNAEVKLGWLNLLIAGPELHRWHHSSDIKEAKSNFGNNLIIWDNLFGTRFLPANKQLQHVGIGNKLWPSSFLAQLTAPFNTSTEVEHSSSRNTES